MTEPMIEVSVIAPLEKWAMKRTDRAWEIRHSGFQPGVKAEFTIVLFQGNEQYACWAEAIDERSITAALDSSPYIGTE